MGGHWKPADPSAKSFLSLHSDVSLTRPATALTPSVSEVCGTKWRSTNILTSSGPKATREQVWDSRLSTCKVGDSVLGVFLPRVLSSEAAGRVTTFLG